MCAAMQARDVRAAALIAAAVALACAPSRGGVAVAAAAAYDCSQDHSQGLVLFHPQRGSAIRKGMIHLTYKAGAGASPHARFYIFVDEDPLSRDEWFGEVFVYGPEENIKVEIEDVGYHTITVVQTCSPDGAGAKMEDDIYVGEVATDFVVVNQTKTGMEMDGVINREPKKYTISAVTLFRDEERYLAEWLEFHLCAGIDHFYLFNHHSSTAEHEAVLAPYIAAGIVELADALDSTLDANGSVIEQAQLRTFAHAVRQHGADSEWMAFIDADEFLYAVGPVSVVDPFHGSFNIDEPSLPDVLLAFREFGGVVVHWVLYGSSGYTETPVGLVIDNYIWRAASPSRMFKVLLSPTAVRSVAAASPPSAHSLPPATSLPWPVC